MSLFGQAVLDLYKNQFKGPFFVCNDYEEDEIDLNYYLNFKPEEHELSALDQLVGRCLDLGCGTGRITRFLADKGFDIWGLDIDPDCIALCKETGIENAFVGSWAEMDSMGAFDSIFLLNRSIGMGGTIDGVFNIFVKCHNCTTENGILLFDSYEVKPEMANVSFGIQVKTLKYRYNNNYSGEFKWINISCNIAEELLTKSGWIPQQITRVDDKYCLIAKKKR